MNGTVTTMQSGLGSAFELNQPLHCSAARDRSVAADGRGVEDSCSGTPMLTMKRRIDVATEADELESRAQLTAAAQILSIMSPERGRSGATVACEMVESREAEQVDSHPDDSGLREQPVERSCLDDDEEDEEDEGRRLLRTWTIASPSPQRRRRCPVDQTLSSDIQTRPKKRVRIQDPRPDYAHRETETKQQLFQKPSTSKPTSLESPVLSSIDPPPSTMQTGQGTFIDATASRASTTSSEGPTPIMTPCPVPIRITAPEPIPFAAPVPAPAKPSSILADLHKILSPTSVPLLPAGLYSVLERATKEGIDQLAGTRRGASRVAEMIRLGEMREDDLSKEKMNRGRLTRNRSAGSRFGARGDGVRGGGGRLEPAQIVLSKKKRAREAAAGAGAADEKSEGRLAVSGIFVYETGQ